MTTWRDRYTVILDALTNPEHQPAVPGEDAAPRVLAAAAVAAEIRAGITAGLLDGPGPDGDLHVPGRCYCRYRADGSLINLDPRCAVLTRPAAEPAEPATPCSCGCGNDQRATR